VLWLAWPKSSFAKYWIWGFEATTFGLMKRRTSLLPYRDSGGFSDRFTGSMGTMGTWGRIRSRSWPERKKGRDTGLRSLGPATLPVFGQEGADFRLGKRFKLRRVEWE
jgi:hypothetical protein